MTGGIAWIDVGTEHIPFDIHIELLCEYSAFFNEHFKDRCTQVVSGTVHLRDCDPDLFIEFVNLVYRGKVFENETRLEWMELIRLWVLGSELGAFLLQNTEISCKSLSLFFATKYTTPQIDQSTFNRWKDGRNLQHLYKYMDRTIQSLLVWNSLQMMIRMYKGCKSIKRHH